MNQTQKNIAEYQQKLPHLKEKLATAILLFVITAAMLITSTFAWVALAVKPEVSNIATSVATNGNLEIALSTGTTEDSSEPNPSRVGDSSLDTLLRNVTWGNLINLNDSRYGLGNLVLRPARLNDNNILENPLYGPVYDGSGRVVDMNTNFGYSTWDGTMNRFKASNKLGVRAITSMTFGESGEQNVYNAKLSAANDANARFQTNYISMANNQDYMDALASMMTGYMVQNILKVNSSVGGLLGDAVLKLSDLRQFYSMYETLIDLFEEQAGVYANLLKLQAEVNKVPNLSITAADILLLSYDKSAKTAYNKLIEMGFTTAASAKTTTIIKDIDSFLYDYYLLKADIVRINSLIDHLTSQNKTSIKWTACPVVDGTTTRLIDDIINNLTNVGECTITGGDYKNLKIKSVGATVAMNLNGKQCQTKITNGILYNLENRSGARIEGKDLSLSVSAMGQTYTIYSNVTTSATDNYFENERAEIAKVIKANYGAPELIANDSYGYALDFWVRTNAANSFLTLQGNVLTRTESHDVKGKNLDGDEVQLYTITVRMNDESSGEQTGSTEGGTSGGINIEDMAVVSYDVYYSTYIPEGEEGEENEVECLRFADSHRVVTPELIGQDEIPTPLKKVETEEIVIGYEGDNRVWEGEKHSLLTVSSTTQGSGSCYVFYPKTPVDQQKSIELLKHMKVAFVDAGGNLLATAQMDTDRQYATTGKVIVPLVLSSDATSLGFDLNGNEKYGISALEQNVATRITAVVYLEGEDLTNDMVLASADIEGTLNIQFGSSVALYPLDNEELYNSELYAQLAEPISPSVFDYETLPDGEEMTSTVKIRVTGTQPKTMTSHFVRYINDTQGSPERTFTLTDADKDGVWEGTYTFTYPGEYIITTVNIDGADRELRLEGDGQFPKVVVKGFAINSLTYSLNDFIMTDSPSYSGNVTLEFRTSDPKKMPTTVLGKFIRDDGVTVNVNFAYNPTLGTWNGNANFVSSGVYTMQYVVLDNQYVQLAESMQKTVDLTLGMRVNVETTSPTTIFYGKKGAPTSLKMQVEILDNNKKIIPNLAGASLTYTMTGTENLYADLVYNSGLECYEGEFPVESGTWKFNYVTVSIGDESKNTLYNVNADAPVFTVVPPTPPSYLGNTAESVQYIKNEDGSANFTVTLKESGSATVYAKLVNKDDTSKVLYLPGTLNSSVNDAYNYIFAIKQSGIWQFEAVSAFGVFDNNQQYHAVPETVNDETFASGMVFDAATAAGVFEEREIIVLAQKDVSISFNFGNASNNVNNSTKTVELGKDDSGNVNAEFMKAHTLANGAVTVTINDTNNLISRGYFTISNVSLMYKYGSTTDGSGKLYGGYTSDEYEGLKNTNVGALKFVHDTGARHKLTSDGDNAVTFRYAAQYTPDEFKYTLTSPSNANVNNAVTLTNVGAYKFEVYSKAPTVTISDITMDDLAQPYAVDTHATDTTDSWSSSSHRNVKSGWVRDYYYKATISSNHLSAANNTQYISKIVDASGNTATSGHTAYLYFKCDHPGRDSSAYSQYGCDYEVSRNGIFGALRNIRYHSYSYNNGNGVPAATLTLSGLGSNATNAKLTFAKTGGGDVQLFTKYTEDPDATTAWTNASDRVNYYEWSNGATTCKRFVGHLDNESGTNGNDQKIAAGTLTASSLEVTYGGKIYYFAIPTITINNPF